MYSTEWQIWIESGMRRLVSLPRPTPGNACMVSSLIWVRICFQGMQAGNDVAQLGLGAASGCAAGGSTLARAHATQHMRDRNLSCHSGPARHFVTRLNQPSTAAGCRAQRGSGPCEQHEITGRIFRYLSGFCSMWCSRLVESRPSSPISSQKEHHQRKTLNLRHLTPTKRRTAIL